MPSFPSNRLRALLGLMPFSEGLGVDLESADPSRVLAPWPGPQSGVPAKESSMKAPLWPSLTLLARFVRTLH